MALTPYEALARSPAARLTPDEIKMADEAEALLDKFLETRWPGVDIGPIKVERATLRTITEVMRRYMRRHWFIEFKPLAGKVESPHQAEALMKLMQSGARIDFAVTLTARWELDTPVSRAVTLELTAGVPTRLVDEPRGCPSTYGDGTWYCTRDAHHQPPHAGGEGGPSFHEWTDEEADVYPRPAPPHPMAGATVTVSIEKTPERR